MKYYNSRMSQLAVVVLAGLQLAVMEVESFAVVDVAGGAMHHRSSPTTTERRLLPSEADVLVQAASLEGIYNHMDMDLDDDNTKIDNHNEESTSPNQAGRNFISRIFHMPAKPRPFHHQGENDAVLFPIVGFTWYNNGEDETNGSFVLPPINTGAACQIHPCSHHEELYGWFTPSSSE
jgi:hypothetical protein